MYKHKVVQGLADLVEAYAGRGRDPMMRAIWFGIKGQVPVILQALDNNEEAIAEIEKKLMEVLDIKPEPPILEVKLEQVSLTRQAATREDKKPAQVSAEAVRKKTYKSKKVEPVAEAEVAVEPLEE